MFSSINVLLTILDNNWIYAYFLIILFQSHTKSAQTVIAMDRQSTPRPGKLIYYLRMYIYKGRPISNIFRYEETMLELRAFAWTLAFLNPATIQRHTCLPPVLDLEKSFKVDLEAGWLS